MLVPGILGFQYVVLGFLLLFCLVIRQKLKNAAERKEEVTRLLAVASEEAAVIEAQAFSEYSCYLKPHQCAVCFCPTTMRCSGCKSVRYCSGKCQIIHWRGGHKDECHPATDSAARKQFDMYSNDSGVEDEFRASLKTSLAEEGEDINVEYEQGTHKDFSTSGSPLSSGVHLSNDFDSGAPKKAAGFKRTEVMPHSSGSESINCVDDKGSLDKNELIHNGEELECRTEVGKGKTLIVDAHSLKETNKNSVKEVSSEMSVTEAPKKTKLLSSSSLRPHSVTNDRKDNSIRSYDASTKPIQSAARKSISSANGNGLTSLQQNASNGFKTSMLKVVQQFKATKQSKSDILGSGNEITGKSNCKIIFPYELFVELYSNPVELFPFGLINCGNSCYANAVLQCLAFTRPLTSYLVQGCHSKACRKKDWCFICEFECLILKAREGKSPLSPIRILSKIQKIGSHLERGKEEDAHEFLRYAVDAMQSVCLKEAGTLGPLAEETTLVGLTFGGYLRSKITCLKCLVKSEIYERMMDLTVEIDGDIGSIYEALAQFTGSEILNGDNKYFCGRCKTYVKAKKKLTILEAPNILTVVLKRFQSGSFGKLNKSVHFPEVLDMGPYMSGASDKSPVYNLYAVVVHLDVMNTAFSGHYVCYVKDSRGQWFRIDDSTVMPVDLERVLQEGAYMLLYSRRTPRGPAMVKRAVDSLAARSKKRDTEAVPSSSKTRCESHTSNAEPSKAEQKHGKHPYRVTSHGSTSKQLACPEDGRLHKTRRIPSTDSWSEISSIFSSSDGSSSSTSTKDSVRSEDFSDYLFSEVGLEWYNRYGMPSDPGASSYKSSHVDSDWDSRKDLEGGLNPAFLYSDSTKHHLRNSSSKETEQVGWANHYDVKSGVSLRRVSGDRSAQPFY